MDWFSCVWVAVADEYESGIRWRPSVAEIFHDCSSNFFQQGKDFCSSPFSLIDAENALSPIQVIESDSDNLADTKSKAHHADRRCMIAQPDWALLGKGIEK